MRTRFLRMKFILATCMALLIVGLVAPATPAMAAQNCSFEVYLVTADFPGGNQGLRAAGYFHCTIPVHVYGEVGIRSCFIGVPEDTHCAHSRTITSAQETWTDGQKTGLLLHGGSCTWPLPDFLMAYANFVTGDEGDPNRQVVFIDTKRWELHFCLLQPE